MKKIIGLVFSLFLLVGVVGCDDDTQANQQEVISKDGKFNSSDLLKNVSDKTFVIKDITSYNDDDTLLIVADVEPALTLKLTKAGIKLSVFNVLKNLQENDEYNKYKEVVIEVQSKLMTSSGNEIEAPVLTASWTSKTLKEINFNNLNSGNYVNSADSFNWTQAYDE